MSDHPNERALKHKRWGAVRIAGIYLVIGSLWILFSDQIAAFLATSPAMLTTISTIKGWGYVFVTAVLLFWLVQREFNELQVSSEKLQESESRYRMLIEQAADALIVHDIDGKLIEVNQHVCDSLGYTQTELLQINLFNIEQDFDKAGAQEKWIKIQPGQPIIIYGHLRRKNGSIFPVEVHFGCMDIHGQRLYMGLARDITERSQAAEALRLSEERFARAFRSSPAALSISTQDEGTFIDVNENFILLSGYSRQELIGHSSTQINLFPIPEARPALINRLAENGTVHDYEMLIRTKSGNIRSISISIELIELDGTAHILSSLIDVTERLHAEQALRESEARYRLLAENMTDAVILMDLNLNLTYASPSMVRMRGFTIEELDALPLDQQMTPESFQRAMAMYQEILSPENLSHPNPRLTSAIELEVFCKDGSKFWSDNLFTVICDDRKQPSMILGTARNISERKLAQEEILRLNVELEQRVYERTAELSDLYNHAPCGYHSLDKNGLVVRINDTELEWLGYTRAEIENKIHFQELFTPESLQTFQKTFPIFKERGWISGLEFDVIRKDGSILSILLSGTAIYDSTGNYLMSRSTMMDNTARKHAEEMMQAYQVKLEAANRELEAFAYSVSHDLRAPLRAIDGFSHIILEDYSGQLDAEGVRLLHIIRSNTQKMDQLITGLLALSRVSRIELNLTRIDMTALVNSIYAEVAGPQTQDQFDFCVSTLPVAYGDPTLLRQAWSNLISNAIKYTLPQSEHKIEIGAYQENEMNVYYIKDSGVGFNPDYAHKLFGVFQRLHKAEQFEGNGVGLAIVQRIILRHGGKVWAEGKTNEGAAFYFSIPKNNGD